MNDMNALSGKLAPKKKNKFSLKDYKTQKYITTIVFMLIPFALLIIFTYIPAAKMIGYSFQERDQFGVNPKFVGFDNYVTIF